jgi:hypothetical protein
MAYTTIKKPSDYFNTVLYTGDDSSNRGITGVGFQPDLVWNKTRNQAFNHYLFDSVRGAGQLIFPNDSAAEQDKSAEFISFDSNGFTVTQNAGSIGINWSSANYANWCWLGANGTASNTDGSITSTVSANTTSGFSIVSYTGTGANGTVGHGLGSAPQVVIVKERSGADSWYVGHASLGFTKNLYLNLTNTPNTETAIFNDTAPTSSVFSLGNNTGINESGSTYITYCFAEKKGFSKFGSYTGNGNADGSFIYLGFKPAFLIVKRTDTANFWLIRDNKRDTFNVSNKTLNADGADTEASWGSTYLIDYLSNGFKCRDATTPINASGGTYIYMAFAEEPLVGDNPATAR